MNVKRLMLVLVSVLPGALGAAPQVRQFEALRHSYLEAIDRFKTIYDGEVEKIELQFQQESLALPQNHMQALRELEQYYQREGELQSLIEVEQARRAFARNPAPDQIRISSKSRRLAALQQSYMSEVEAARRQRDQRVGLLTERYQQRLEQHRTDYLRALERLQRELTQKGDIHAALQVLRESEHIRAGGAAGVARPGSDRPPPGQERDAAPQVSLETLRRVMHGDVIEWNSETRHIVLAYDFGKPESERDWPGATRDASRQMLVFDRTVAWLRPPFDQIAEIEVEMMFLDESRQARLALGQTDAVDLTVELAGNRGDPRIQLFQTSANHPVAAQSADLKMFIENHVALQLQQETLFWTVNYGERQRGRLQKHMGSPIALGGGHPQAVSGYRRLRIRGVLSERYVRQIAGR